MGKKLLDEGMGLIFFPFCMIHVYVSKELEFNVFFKFKISIRGQSTVRLPGLTHTNVVP